MIAFRDQRAADTGVELLVHTNPDGVAPGHRPDHPRRHRAHRRDEDPGAASRRWTLHGFDAAIGGARRDEEKSRAKERMFSLPQRAAPLGPEERSGPELWNLYNTRIHQGESVRVFPLSNWTELDVWLYIYRENIPVVPLYFAARAAGGGARRRADHGRRRAHAAARRARRRMLQQVRFRTLGCYPLTGAIESEADTLEAIIAEMLVATHVRAPGPGDRPRSRRLDGEEEAGGLFLMSRTRRRTSPPTCSSTSQAAAALHHLRQRRRRQEHADRPPAARHQAAARRPAGRAGSATAARHGTQGDDIDFALLVDGLEAEREQGITIDVAYRFFEHRQAQVHRRRLPGPRAVHPQHGHRRVHRRPRGRAGRCAQGPADADPPAQLHRLAARHPPRGAGGQQDGPGRLRPGRVRRASSRTTASWPRSSASTTSPRSRCRRCTGDNVLARIAGDALVSRPERCWSTWKPCERRPRRSRRRRRSACRCSG